MKSALNINYASEDGAEAPLGGTRGLGTASSPVTSPPCRPPRNRSRLPGRYPALTPSAPAARWVRRGSDEGPPEKPGVRRPGKQPVTQLRLFNRPLR